MEDVAEFLLHCGDMGRNLRRLGQDRDIGVGNDAAFGFNERNRVAEKDT